MEINFDSFQIFQLEFIRKKDGYYLDTYLKSSDRDEAKNFAEQIWNQKLVWYVKLEDSDGDEIIFEQREHPVVTLEQIIKLIEIVKLKLSLNEMRNKYQKLEKQLIDDLPEIDGANKYSCYGANHTLKLLAEAQGAINAIQKCIEDRACGLSDTERKDIESVIESNDSDNLSDIIIFKRVWKKLDEIDNPEKEKDVYRKLHKSSIGGLKAGEIMEWFN